MLSITITYTFEFPARYFGVIFVEDILRQFNNLIIYLLFYNILIYYLIYNEVLIYILYLKQNIKSSAEI